ncbi:MAG: CotH kinase family protein [Muribaculaceae bacterium]|nr:CotH kinase family protein [Muribaculaceae bacterium]
MKEYLLGACLFGTLLASGATTLPDSLAARQWLHIYSKEGLREFKAYPYQNIQNFEFISNDDTSNDETASHKSAPFQSEESAFHVMVVNQADGRSDSIPMSHIDHFEFAADLPVIDIRLKDYPEKVELWDKELYLDATVNIDGGGVYEDLSDWSTTIKGRGNSTWMMPKKPYRFKAGKKISLFGLPKAKSYALLANYIDPTHVRNYLSLQLAQRLGLPFTNSCIPVRITFNGIDKGLYMLTEKLGIGSASVDIDEEQGYLLELDAGFDEDYKFYSEPYGLPVMIKDPDLSEIYPDDPEGKLSEIEQDFNEMLTKIANCNDESWRELIDTNSLVNYLMVFSFACNNELSHPKSCFIYRPGPDEKYYFGPVWDFDWCYGFTDSTPELLSPERWLFASWGTTPGAKFFYRLTQLPGFMDEYISRWDEMVATIYPSLMSDMEEYANSLRPAALGDALIWDNKDEKGAFEYDRHIEHSRNG